MDIFEKLREEIRDIEKLKSEGVSKEKRKEILLRTIKKYKKILRGDENE